MFEKNFLFQSLREKIQLIFLNFILEFLFQIEKNKGKLIKIIFQINNFRLGKKEKRKNKIIREKGIWRESTRKGRMDKRYIESCDKVETLNDEEYTTL